MVVRKRRLLLMAPPAAAAASFYTPAWQASQHKTGNGATPTGTITTTATVAAGDLILIESWRTNSRSISSVTDNAGVGNTYAWTSGVVHNTDERLSMIYLVAAGSTPSGTIITITYSGSCANLQVCQSFTGPFNASPLDISGTGYTATDNNPVRTDPGAAGQSHVLVVEQTFVANYQGVHTADSNFSNLYQHIRGTTGYMAMSSKAVTNGTVGSLAESYTGTAALWFTNVFTFKTAAA